MTRQHDQHRVCGQRLKTRWSAFWKRSARAIMMTAALAPLPAMAQVEKLSYKGWPEAYRLSNADVEMIIVPAVGRIMRYARIDGPNILWENPHRAGHVGDDVKWPNVGGDKIWPWPESLWRKLVPDQWRPPRAWDITPHQAEIIGDRTLRLTSPPIRQFGVEVVREFTLADSGTRVTIATRYQQNGPVTDNPIAIWAVTQVPLPDLLLVGISPNTSPTWMVTFGPAWQKIQRPQDHVIALQCDELGRKLSFNSQILGALSHGDLFLQTMVMPCTESWKWEPFAQAHIYSGLWESLTDLPDRNPPYAEMEFTSPKFNMAAQDGPTAMTVTWELVAMPSKGNDAQHAAIQEFSRRAVKLCTNPEFMATTALSP